MFAAVERVVQTHTSKDIIEAILLSSFALTASRMSAIVKHGAGRVTNRADEKLEIRDKRLRARRLGHVELAGLFFELAQGAFPTKSMFPETMSEQRTVEDACVENTEPLLKPAGVERRSFGFSTGVAFAFRVDRVHRAASG